VTLKAERIQHWLGSRRVADRPGRTLPRRPPGSSRSRRFAKPQSKSRPKGAGAGEAEGRRRGGRRRRRPKLRVAAAAPAVVRASRRARGALLSMRKVLDALRKGPHPEEAAKQPSRRTHSADPAEEGGSASGSLPGPRGVQGAVRIKSFTEVPVDRSPAMARWRTKPAERQFDLHLWRRSQGRSGPRLPGIEEPRPSRGVARTASLSPPLGSAGKPEVEEY